MVSLAQDIQKTNLGNGKFLLVKQKPLWGAAMEVLLSSTCDVLMLGGPEPGKRKPRSRVLICWGKKHVLPCACTFAG